jgi:glycosyltransferase involved in cell wall biosynthesis
MISACGVLRRRGLDFETLLVGDGPEREDVKRMIEQEDLTQFFRFMGQRNDVPLILAAADLFVLSSLSEGLPRSIMEAMASLLPVVATDVGGVGELVRHGFTGYLVPSEDTEALAERMAEILENPALGKAMGEAGYQKLLEEFNMERRAADMDRIYTDIASLA